MLTTAEEDRLEEAIPFEHAVEYEGDTFEYELTPFWSGGDESGDDAAGSPEYPSIVFDWDVQGEPDEDRQPAGGVARVDAKGPDEYTETRVARVWDDLSITIAVHREHDENGVPPGVRGGQIARSVWNFMLFEIDLNSQGQDGERPLVIDVLNAPTPATVERTLRYEFSIRIRHTLEHEVVYDTAQELDVDVNIEPPSE